MSIALGIDCGTQSTKCVALDSETGTILTSSQQPHDLIPGLPPGAMEQHPQDWIAAADTAITATLQQLGPRRAEVRAIGISGQQHGLVLLDAHGQVIRPAKLWCDTTTTEECAELTHALGGHQSVLDQLGNAFLPGYTAPKILWVKKHEPHHFARIRSVLLPHDYLNHWLTGTLTMECGDASGTALLNIRTRQWSDAAIAAIDPALKDWLPPLQSSLAPAGTLRKNLAEKWALPGQVTISAGGGDNMMGAIGTGNLTPGTVTASLGTSGTLYAFSENPIIDPKGEVAAFCDSTDFWLPLVCTMNVTLVTELARGLFTMSHDSFAAAASSVPMGSDGLLMLPYLAGERTPNYPNARGILLGLTTQNFTPAHLCRAALEGVTLGLAYGIQRFRELGLKPSEIRLTGGGSKSPFWRQLCADLFQTPTVCLTQTEGAAFGAALQALATAAAPDSPQTARQHLLALARSFCTLDESTRCLPAPEAAEPAAALLTRAGSARAALSSAGLLN